MPHEMFRNRQAQCLPSRGSALVHQHYTCEEETMNDRLSANQGLSISLNSDKPRNILSGSFLGTKTELAHILIYHPYKENYQRNSENNFFGTVTGYQSPNNSRRAIFGIGNFVLPTQILGNLLLPI